MSGHVVTIAADRSRELVCPPRCVECPEGDYVERYGFDFARTWQPGTYPVAWWGGFYGDEWDEGVGVDMERWTPAEPAIIDPAPPMRVVRELRQDRVKRALRRLEPGVQK